jgi:hypothetical protein
MKPLIATILFFLCLPAFAAVSDDLKAAEHLTAHSIVMRLGFHGAGCSATAISEHVLLTAAHCYIEDAALYIDQVSAPYMNPQTVSEVYFDHHDHALLVIRSVKFKVYFPYAVDMAPLAQGEHYYMWGNPAMMADQYREGYTTGRLADLYERQHDVDVITPYLLLSGPVVGGDSGSGIFGDDGRLAGVLTYSVEDGKFAGVYPLAFTAAQLAQATDQGTFAYLPDTKPTVVVKELLRPEPAAKPDSRLFWLGVIVVAFFATRFIIETRLIVRLLIGIGRASKYLLAACLPRGARHLRPVQEISHGLESNIVLDKPSNAGLVSPDGGF